MAFELYNFRDNTFHPVDSHTQAEEYLRSGYFGPKKGVEYDLTSPSNNRIKVPAEDLFKALNEGYSLTPSQIVDYENEVKKIQDDPFSPLKSFGYGVVDMASLGLVSSLAKNAFGYDPKKLQALKEANPTMNLLGSGAAMFGLPILSGLSKAEGLLGLAGRAAGVTGPGVARTFGTGTAKAIQKKLGAGATDAAIGNATGLLAKSASTAGEFGAELGVFSIAHSLDENTFEDKPLTAQNIIMHAVTEGAVGAFIGGSLPFVGKAFSSVANAAKKAGSATLSSLTGVEAQTVEEILANPDLIKKVDQSLAEGKGIEYAATEISNAVAKLREEIASGNRSVGDAKELIKSTMKGAKEDLSKAEAIFEDARREALDALKARPISDEGIQSAKNAFGRLKTDINSINEEVYKLLDDAELAGIEIPISKSDVFGRIDKEAEGLLAVDRADATLAAVKKLQGIKENLNDLPEKLSPRDVKLIIKTLQNSKSWKPMEYRGALSRYYKALDEIRIGVDSIIKDKAVLPKYEELMAELSSRANVSSVLGKNFLNDNLETFLSRLDSPSNRKYLPHLEKLEELTGTRFVDDVFTELRFKDAIKDRNLVNYIPPSNAAVERQLDIIKQLNPDIVGKLDDVVALRRTIEQLKPPQEAKYILSKGIEANERLQLKQAEGKLTEIENRIYKYLKKQPDEKLVGNEQVLVDIWKKEVRAGREANPFSSFQDPAQAKENLEKLWRKNNAKAKQTFDILASMSDENLRDIVDLARINRAFDKTYIRGSRNVNLWGAIGAFLASLLPTDDGALGVVKFLSIAGGAFFGNIVDHFGPKMAKSIFKGFASIDGVITNSKVASVMAKNAPEYAGSMVKGAAKLFQEIERANERGRQEVEENVGDFFKAKETVKERTLFPATGSVRNSFSKALKDVNEYSLDPEGYASRFAEENDFFFTVAPEVAGNVLNTMTRGMEFLASKAPEIENSPIFEQEPPYIDMLNFLTYYNAVNRPAQIVENFGKGYLRKEEIETLWTLYPDYLDQIQERLMTDIMNGKKLKYWQMDVATDVLGIQLDVLQDPNVILSLQSNFQTEEEREQQEMGTGSKTTRKVSGKIGKNWETTGQKMQQIS